LNNGLAVLRQHFIILAQPSVSPEPSERPLHHPSAGENRESPDIVISFNDFKGPSVGLFDPGNQLPSISTVRPDQSKSREAILQSSQDRLGSVTILLVGGMHDESDDQPDRIDNDVTFASEDLLASVISAKPPFSVVFTLWLSMIPALGVDSRPASRRTSSRSEPCTFCHTPLRRKLRKYV
jgi:hypothetical protein